MHTLLKTYSDILYAGSMVLSNLTQTKYWIHFQWNGCYDAVCLLLLLLLLHQKTMLLDKAEAVYVWNRFVLKCSPQNGNARASSCATHKRRKCRENRRKNGSERDKERTKKTFLERAHQREHYQYMCVSYASFHKHMHTTQTHTGSVHGNRRTLFSSSSKT